MNILYCCITDMIGASDKSVATPIFSPDHTKFVYLENNAGGPHMHCRKLKMVRRKLISISVQI